MKLRYVSYMVSLNFADNIAIGKGRHMTAIGKCTLNVTTRELHRFYLSCLVFSKSTLFAIIGKELSKTNLSNSKLIEI